MLDVGKLIPKFFVKFLISVTSFSSMLDVGKLISIYCQ